MGDDALYKSPAFQFYADDFIADTADLTAEEVGVYMRLLCHQWKQGGIPNECTRQALIGGISSQRMRVVWKSLASKYQTHPSNESLLIQPRLERVRQEAAEHRARRAQAGSLGGRARASRIDPSIVEAVEDVSNAIAMLEQSQSNAVAMGVANAKQKPSSPVSYSIPTPSVDKSTSVVGTRSPKSNTTWVEPLRESARAIAGKSIQNLTLDERQILARYHCLEFANCTKTEANNKARATQVAAAFASMGRSKHYGDMSVREYVGYARKVHEQREKTPWFDPWLIRAFVEWENG